MLDRFIGAAGSIKRHKSAFLLAIFAPVLLLFIIIRVLPIFLTLLFAFTNYTFAKPVIAFRGLMQIQKLISDPTVHRAFLNSFEFVLISVPAVVVIGFMFAFLLNQDVSFSGPFETFYFLPYIIPIVPAAIIWTWIYSPGEVGILNNILGRLGLPYVPWLSRPRLTVVSIIVMFIWKRLGYYVIIFLVGLKNIDPNLKDAALVDGANPWQRLTMIDIPVMRPIILYATIFGTIVAMAVFTEVYIMTAGTDTVGGQELYVVATKIYTEAFLYMKIGYASAISLALFIVSFILVFLQFKLLQSR